MMKKFQSYHDFINENGKLSFSLTIGNFDGVHLGHQNILRNFIELSKKKSLIPVVLTFHPHPKKILNPQQKNFLLSSYIQRRQLLSLCGVEYLIEEPFDRNLSTLSPEDFLNNVLFKHKGLSLLYLGHDFAFGANKSGDSTLVEKLCKNTGIELIKAQALSIAGELPSSSLIRAYLASGEVAKANKLLDRKFSIEGLVVKGEGRGKKIGFPTANLKLDEDLLLPTSGVYITQTQYKNMTYQSLSNLGVNPTFNMGAVLGLETHILDFDSDIYGEKLCISFIEKIRAEKKFSSVNELISQIQKDIIFSREFFKL